MCGVFGVSLPGASTEQRVKIAEILATTMEPRGRQAFGLLGVNTGEVVKATGRITHEKGLAEVRKIAESNSVFLGHTRYPTEGANTPENAHPFVGYDLERFYSNGDTLDRTRPCVVGIHNGSVSNHSELNREHRRRYQVDSMHLIAALQEGRDWSSIRGYGTVVWNWSDSHAIYVTRFNNGSLAVGIITTKNESGEDVRVGALLASTNEPFERIMRELPELKIRLVTTEEKAVYFLRDGRVWVTQETVNPGVRYSSVGSTYSGYQAQGRKSSVDQADRDWGDVSQSVATLANWPEMLTRKHGIALVRRIVAHVFRGDRTTKIPSFGSEARWGLASEVEHTGNATEKDLCSFARDKIPRKAWDIAIEEMRARPEQAPQAWFESWRPRYQAWLADPTVSTQDCSTGSCE